MESNSVCNHTSDDKIGQPCCGSPILFIPGVITNCRNSFLPSSCIRRPQAKTTQREGKVDRRKIERIDVKNSLPYAWINNFSAIQRICGQRINVDISGRLILIVAVPVGLEVGFVSVVVSVGLVASVQSCIIICINIRLRESFNHVDGRRVISLKNKEGKFLKKLWCCVGGRV